MGAYNEVFARSEKKYLITPEQYTGFFKSVKDHLVPAKYGESTIRSLYYDTPQDAMINRSLEKPLYKEKIRLRSYCLPQEGSLAFIEIKKKFKGTVYKRRIGVSYDAARAIMRGTAYRRAIERYPLSDTLLQEQCHSTKALQIASEVAYLVDRYQNLAPAMLITVHRSSWVNAEDDIRITYDEGATWQNNHPVLTTEESGHKLFDSGERILEVKCASAYPAWLLSALDSGKIYPCSVSKYGRAYKAAYRQACAPERERLLEPLEKPFASPFFPGAGTRQQPAQRGFTAPRPAAQPIAVGAAAGPQHSRKTKLAHAKHAAKEGAYCA